MKTEIEYTTRFPESRYEPLNWDSEEASVQIFSLNELTETSSGGEDENVKSLQTDGRKDRQSDDGRQVIRKGYLNF